jgi:hypothetical protein
MWLHQLYRLDGSALLPCVRKVQVAGALVQLAPIAVIVLSPNDIHVVA